MKIKYWSLSISQVNKHDNIYFGNNSFLLTLTLIYFGILNIEFTKYKRVNNLKYNNSWNVHRRITKLQYNMRIQLLIPDFWHTDIWKSISLHLAYDLFTFMMLLHKNSIFWENLWLVTLCDLAQIVGLYLTILNLCWTFQKISKMIGVQCWHWIQVSRFTPPHSSHEV